MGHRGGGGVEVGWGAQGSGARVSARREGGIFFCCGRHSHQGLGVAQTDEKVTEASQTLTLQPLFFWKNAKGTPQKKQGFFFAEPLKSLEKKGKTHKTARESGKKTRKTKEEGQGKVTKYEETRPNSFCQPPCAPP